MAHWQILTLLVVLCGAPNALYAMFRPPVPKDIRMVNTGIDPGQPLFLTPYIEKGEIEKARELSVVGALNGTSVKSYSGYFTVNATYNSNMFFWFFPAQADPLNAPVLVWLQGGPGASSMFGLFAEIGPFSVLKNSTLEERIYTWNKKYSLIFIDNPVGTGFSFTDNDKGYATNEVDVGRDLYSCLTQFFQVYYEYRKNDFYIAGESYGGKYVPAIAYKIHVENPTAQLKINMKGISIGDGFSDPISMIPQYAPFLFNIGVFDENERDFFQNETDQAVKYMQQGKWMEAFEIFDMLLNGDIFKYGAYFINVTGTSDYDNFLRTVGPESFGYFYRYLLQSEVRRAIHVGNLTFNDGTAVEMHMLNDFMQSVKPWVTTLMDNYKVLFYNGQLDIIVAVPLTEAFLRTVPWSGQAAYLTTPKIIWKINPTDTDVAGYVRQVKNFYQVVVRVAGHILPYDQPARAFDMIDRFINNKGF